MMWVFHSVFLIHFPVLFCMWWRIWTFIDVGAAALLKLLELQSLFSAAFCLPLTLHSNLQGEAALKLLLLERKKGSCEFQHLRATCRRLNALSPQRSAAVWEAFLPAWGCRKSVMWFFFFFSPQTLKRELLFVLYMASVPWKLAMEREVLVSTNGCKKNPKKHCLHAGKVTDVFSQRQAAGSSMTILVCFCVNPNPQLSKYVAQGRLLRVI